MPPGPGWRSELRRAKRAGAQNRIQDAGALRAPGRTNVFLSFVKIELWLALFSVNFSPFRTISGAKLSYSAFSDRVSEMYRWACC